MSMSMKVDFLKNICIFNNQLLDCFDDKGYKKELIGVYNPNSKEILEFLTNYQYFGFRFLIYISNDLIIDKDLDIQVESDFRKFYKQIDMFIINSIKDYHLLIDDLAGMEEKIFIFDN